MWIISRDGDYGIEQGDSFLLNPLLRKEVEDAWDDREAEVHCFKDLLEGLKHFGNHAGVPAKKLPTKEQAAKIKREEAERSRAADLIVDIYPRILPRSLVSEPSMEEILASIRRIIREDKDRKSSEESNK